MTSRFAPQLVLFDLDGTLVDSVKDLASAAQQTMNSLGHAPPDIGKVREYVGNGIERLVHRCLTGRMNADAAPEQFERAIERFMADYEQHNAKHSTVYAGVPEGLDAIARSGVRMGCVTNKSARFTSPLLEALGLAKYFELVVCGDTTAHKKPHPAPLIYALGRSSLTPEQALFVGDSSNDVLAARAARMPVVCVNYGYNHGRDIADSRPDAVLDSLVDLPPLLLS